MRLRWTARDQGSGAKGGTEGGKGIPARSRTAWPLYCISEANYETQREADLLPACFTEVVPVRDGDGPHYFSRLVCLIQDAVRATLAVQPFITLGGVGGSDA